MRFRTSYNRENISYFLYLITVKGKITFFSEFDLKRPVKKAPTLDTKLENFNFFDTLPITAPGMLIYS